MRRTFTSRCIHSELSKPRALLLAERLTISEPKAKEVERLDVLAVDVCVRRSYGAGKVGVSFGCSLMLRKHVTRLA